MNGKKVKNTNEASYSYYTEIEPSGRYTYQLRYQSNSINTARELILFDSLENFKIVNSKEGTTKTSEFNIANIVREKINAGVPPKVLFLENVRGLKNHDKGNTLNVILATLEGMIMSRFSSA